jgi:hypothetical protein
MGTLKLRELVFALAIMGVGLYFQLSWLGICILAGVALSVVIIRRGEPSFQLGAVCLGVGIVCLLLSFYFADRHGVTFDGLRSLAGVGKFVRGLPSFCYTALTMGVLLMAYRGLGVLGEKAD